MAAGPGTPASQGGRTLGRRASFWVAAAVVVHTLWTSAAPAMTYPLYAAEWHLTPVVITAIFAIYPVFAVAMLVIFGDLSDYIGRRQTMLYGLAASLIGVLLFATAQNVYWVFLGRAFMGTGVGLSAAPSAAALVEFSAPGMSERAGAITTAGQVLGLALALLMSGFLIEYAPWPTRLSFWVLVMFIAAVFAATWFLPRHTDLEAAGRWRPRVPSVPRALRDVFTISTIVVAVGYSLGAMMMSLGAQIAHDLIHSSNHLVNGAAISLLTVTAGPVAYFAKRLAPRLSMLLGGGASVLGMGLLALATNEQSLGVFLAAGAVAGAGYGLCLTGGLTLINASAPAHHRGATLSTLFIIAYLAQGVFALTLGWVATRWHLAIAIDLGTATIAFFGLVTMGLALARRKPVPSPETAELR